MANDFVSGVSGDELEGLAWRIAFNIYTFIQPIWLDQRKMEIKFKLMFIETKLQSLTIIDYSIFNDLANFNQLLLSATIP